MTMILVVDDSPVDRRMMGALIEKQMDAEIVYAVDGRDALTVMKSEQIVLVVTDIEMPEMNGLELLLAIKEKWPHVPVVIKTGFGTEEIAVKALHAGAASYVPSHEMASMLGKTVEEVLAASNEDRSHTEFLNEMTSASFSFSLTDLSSSESLVNYLSTPLTYMHRCDETERRCVGIALREALTNAFERGNMELARELAELDQSQYYELLKTRASASPYKERRIFVDASISRNEARYVIRDEGPGFDPATLPDPHDPMNVTNHHGRGNILMRTFMDDVIYNDVANEVTLLKLRRAECAPGSGPVFGFAE